MKASQITTRNRTTHAITRSLAAVTLLTFFAAGHADARCPEQVMIESRILEVDRRGLQDLGVHDGGRLTQVRPPVQQPVFNHNFDNTAVPINDDLRQRRKEEEQRLRQQVIDGLKQAGVIREPGESQTSAQDNTNSSTANTTQNDNGNGSTTQPAPTPKPKEPKVTNLPNGDQITDYPDGRREVKLKNGDTVTSYPNGKRVIRSANGDVTETHPSGYRKTTDRTGEGTARYPDGTRVDYKFTGEATLTTPDGWVFHRDPGGEFKPVD